MALLLYSEAAAIAKSRQNRLGVRIAYLGWFPVNPPIAQNAMDGAPVNPPIPQRTRNGWGTRKHDKTHAGVLRLRDSR